jgi:hypothetical protein
MDQRYTFNEDQIVHEVLDDEVVLVNLDNGHYYMLQGTGALIWQAVSAGATVSETAAALQRRYTGSPAEIAAAVRGFVDHLAQEALLQSALEGSGSPPAFEAAAAPAPFTPPVMFRYTDMANLIQMDPIREYDETGWPRRRSANPKPGA